MKIIKETINIHHYLRNRFDFWDLFVKLSELVRRFNKLISIRCKNKNADKNLISISVEFGGEKVDKIVKIVLRYNASHKAEILPYEETKINATRILEFIFEVSRSCGILKNVIVHGNPSDNPQRPAFFTFILDGVEYEYYVWNP